MMLSGNIITEDNGTPEWRRFSSFAGGGIRNVIEMRDCRACISTRLNVCTNYKLECPVCGFAHSGIFYSGYSILTCRCSSRIAINYCASLNRHVITAIAYNSELSADDDIV